MVKKSFIMNSFYLSLILSTFVSLGIFFLYGITFQTLLLCFVTFNLNITSFVLIAIIILNVTTSTKRRVMLFSFFTSFILFFYITNFIFLVFWGEGIRLQLFFFTYKFSPRGSLAVIVFIVVVLLFILFSLIYRFLSRGLELQKRLQKKKRIKKNTLSQSQRFLLYSFILFVIVSFLFLGFNINKIFNKNNSNPLLVKWDSTFYSIDAPFLDELLQRNKPRVLNMTLENTNQNVVIILIDSLTYDKIYYYGKEERNLSPHIDALAEQSLVFWNAYATASHSDYSQTAFLSSRHTLVNNQNNFFYPYPRAFIWDVFKKENYTTAYISSQDDNWALMNQYFNYSQLDFYSYSLTDGDYDYGGGKAKKDLDDKTANKTIAWLNNRSTEPYFLYVNFQATHSPYAIPPEKEVYPSEGRVKFIPREFQDQQIIINTYDNAVLFVDEQVGKIIETLEERGDMNNTIILISADHGEDVLNRHDIFGHGMSLYDEEIHVPFILYIPRVSHRDIYDRVQQIDFFPTLLDLLGYDIPKEFQGNIMKKGNLIISYTQSFRYIISSILGNQKVILNMQEETIEVYNLHDDPLEQNNLVQDVDYSNQFYAMISWYNCQMRYYEKELWEERLYVPRC